VRVSYRDRQDSGAVFPRKWRLNLSRRRKSDPGLLFSEAFYSDPDKEVPMVVYVDEGGEKVFLGTPFY